MISDMFAVLSPMGPLKIVLDFLHAPEQREQLDRLKHSFAYIGSNALMH